MVKLMVDKKLKKDLEELGIFGFDENTVIDLNDDVEADIVLEKKNYFGWLKFLWFIPISAFIVLSVFALVTLNNNRIIKEDVSGYNFQFGKISVIDKDYQLNIGDIAPGQKVVYTDSESPSNFPIVSDYKIATVKEVDKGQLKVLVEYPNKKHPSKVESRWVLMPQILYFIEK